MAKHFVQLLVAGAQVVGRAFAKALRQEIAASQAAAQRAGGGAVGAKHSATNQKLGMSLEEAKQILNVEELEAESIQKNYQYLFDINDKAKGGSFYIQSKMSMAGVTKCLQGWGSLMRSHSRTVTSLPAGIMSPGSLRYLTTDTFDAIMSENNCIQLKHSLKSHSQSVAPLPGGIISPGPLRYLTTQSDHFDDILSDDNRSKLKSRLEKIAPSRNFNHKPKRFAAVLIPLCHVDGELSMLVTVRCRNLNSHAGEVSFPGGMADPLDKTHTDTALRETEEEIGIPRSSVDVLAVLPPVPDRIGGTSIRGVLGYVGHVDETTFKLSEGEVDSVVAISLRNLCVSQNARQTQFRSAKIQNGYTLPVFIGSEPRIWGLTAIITHMALVSLLPGHYKHKLKHLPPFIKYSKVV